jgi:AbrB family looped-hinge helix DNA binding protein
MKVKVSGRGQICLPVTFRKQLKIAAGDVLEVIENGENLILSPVKKKRSKEKTDELLNRTSGMWKHIDTEGTKIVRELRKGSTRDVWGSQADPNRY